MPEPGAATTAGPGAPRATSDADVSRLRSFLTTLTGRPRFEDSLDEEVRLRLPASRGTRRRVPVHFAGVERAQDECRSARGLRFLGELRQDVGAGVRTLRRAPASLFSQFCA